MRKALDIKPGDKLELTLVGMKMQISKIKPQRREKSRKMLALKNKIKPLINTD